MQRCARTLAVLVASLALPASASAQAGTSGGGSFRHHTGPCLTAQQRRDVHVALMQARRNLAGAGFLALAPSTPLELASLEPRVRLQWPVRSAGAAASDPAVHGISYYFDHDPSGGMLDHECGTRTYDGHRGTDIFSWPFPWLRMATDEVEVVAGAPGVILLKSDGNFDQHCGWTGAPWNAVFVQHFDGSVAWYGHLKKNSLTTRPVGSFVSAGEFLGVMGSSGNSTGVHLHLELHDASGAAVDPFRGACDPGFPYPWWGVDRPYYDSGVNRIQVGDGPFTPSSCPLPGAMNDGGVVARGTFGYFTIFYRDLLPGQVTEFRLRRPDGTVYFPWTWTSSGPFDETHWRFWTRFIGSGEPAGTWTFEVRFEGQLVQKSFTVI